MPWGLESLLIIIRHILFLKQERIHTHSSCTGGQRGMTDQQRPLKGVLSVVLIAGLCLGQTSWSWIFKPETHSADRTLQVDFLFLWMCSWPIFPTLAQHDGSPATPSLQLHGKKMDGMSERSTSKQDKKKNNNNGKISSVNILKVIGKLKMIGNVIVTSSKIKNLKENTLNDWVWLHPRWFITPHCC